MQDMLQLQLLLEVSTRSYYCCIRYKGAVVDPLRKQGKTSVTVAADAGSTPASDSLGRKEKPILQ